MPTALHTHMAPPCQHRSPLGVLFRGTLAGEAGVEPGTLQSAVSLCTTAATTRLLLQIFRLHVGLSLSVVLPKEFSKIKTFDVFFISPRNQASGTFCCDHGSITEIPVTQRAFPSGPAIRENFPQHPGHSRPAGCWTLDTRSLPRSPCCSALFSSLSSTGENSVLFRDSGGFVALVLFSYKTVLNFVFKYWAKQKKKRSHPQNRTHRNDSKKSAWGGLVPSLGERLSCLGEDRLQREECCHSSLPSITFPSRVRLSLGLNADWSEPMSYIVI